MIRQLTEHDAGSYRALRLKGLKECPDAFTSSLEFEISQPDEWFCAALRENLVLGNFTEKKLTACIGLGVNRRQEKIAHKGYIWGVYVARSERGNGLAKKLIRKIITHAETLGLEMLQLGVGDYNTPALALYSSFGFESYGVEKHALKIGERYIDEILMMKDLR